MLTVCVFLQFPLTLVSFLLLKTTRMWILMRNYEYHLLLDRNWGPREFLSYFSLHLHIFHWTVWDPRTNLTEITLANCLALLPKGVLQIMPTLVLKNFLDDLGYKIILSLQRVSWGLSLTMTCLLSVFQVIIITPSSFNLAECKARASKYIVLSSLFS